MKITKSQLREIIQEERAQILTELGVLDKFKDFLKSLTHLSNDSQSFI